MEPYKLYAVRSWGSAIVELAFELSGLAYTVEYLSNEEVHTSEFRKMSPLEQIPTLLLPDGEIMTESLAICLFIDAKGRGGLVPQKGSHDYHRFLRWAVFLVSSIYSLAPTADHPEWFVSERSAQLQLQEESMRRAKDRFLLMEKEARAPWFLGDQLSVIDLFLAVMSTWDPGREWFEANCPEIMKNVGRVEEMPELDIVFKRNSR
ncbi:MAG TPA: glutathione S-transferase family protein [Bacteriovoracaceae bacterium]|nr:glutathione S-transferase family protein [Bacteriovoracaceae bacterium]